MVLDEADSGLSWREARAAAARVRRAERGRNALRTVRPRGGLVRARGPLAVILYAAAREGRLVRQHDGGFALLEPPLVSRQWRRPGGIGAWSSRLADRHWGVMVLAVPPMVTLLGAAALALFGSMRIGALLLVVLALGHVAVLLIGQVVQAMLWLGRTFAGSSRHGAALEPDQLAGYHWSVPLCHQEDPARMPALLRQIEHRLGRLILARVTADAARLGGRVQLAEVTETLVCLLDGATTEQAAEAISAATTRSRFLGDSTKVAFMVQPGTKPGARHRSVDAGGFFLLYLAAMVVAVPALAFLASGYERDACAPHCAGRPASFPAALHWLSERLLLHDPSGITPHTTQGLVLGWLTSGLAVMLVPVAITAVSRLKQHEQAKREAYEEEVGMVRGQTRVLIIVVTPDEREAVFAAVKRVNQETPTTRHLQEDTVFDLGTVSNARILLAQSEPGMLAPGAAMLTAQSAIQELDPDYVMLTGICYGLKDDQRLGDVLVATQVRILDHKKVVDPRESGAPPVELSRGARPDPSARLRSRARAATRNWPLRDVHSVHFGAMLTLNTLVDSSEFRKRLIEAHEDAIGGEMESGGVYAASAKARVDWLMVKAIADWGMDKGDEAHAEATASAASFVVHIISEGGLDDPVR